MDFKEHIIEKIVDITGLEREVVEKSVEVPPDEKMGDIAFPCFPLAKVMRKELRKRNVDSLKVIYSKEEPIVPVSEAESSCKTNCICPPGTKRICSIRNQVPGSISFVPSVAGLMIAGEIIKDILKKH